MNIEIADYNASLALPHLPLETVRQIQAEAKEILSELLVNPDYLDFEYSGRDADRKIVKFLCRIAPLVGTAEGEVECRLVTDMDERVLEFYSIRHGRLYKEAAKIVRMPPLEVCLDISAAELQLSK